MFPNYKEFQRYEQATVIADPHVPAQVADIYLVTVREALSDSQAAHLRNYVGEALLDKRIGELTVIELSNIGLPLSDALYQRTPNAGNLALWALRELLERAIPTL